MWAVVALKSPEQAKSRLATVLDAAQRRDLFFALARQVIGALHVARGVDEVAVVTSDASVADFAQALDAQVIRQPGDFGTASAFAAAVQHLRPLKLDRLLMIAGDLPLVSASALERLIAAGATTSVVVVPDRQRTGTNALLCTPPDALAPCFGPDSFQRHLAAAAAAGVSARVLEIDELALDLDCAADFHEWRLRTGAQPAMAQ